MGTKSLNNHVKLNKFKTKRDSSLTNILFVKSIVSFNFGKTNCLVVCLSHFVSNDVVLLFEHCSLLSKEVFEGAEGNLLRIFEKNRSILHRIKELPLDEPRPKERWVEK